jgi:regulator of replication initiation timing
MSIEEIVEELKELDQKAKKTDAEVEQVKVRSAKAMDDVAKVNEEATKIQHRLKSAS